MFDSRLPTWRPNPAFASRNLVVQRTRALPSETRTIEAQSAGGPYVRAVQPTGEPTPLYGPRGTMVHASDPSRTIDELPSDVRPGKKANVFPYEVGTADPATSEDGAAATEASEPSEGATDARAANGQPLDETEQAQVEQLKKRDAEVRAHEQAHKAVAGPYAGAISYTYEQGPDGRRYAVGGSVPIDMSEVPGDPQATIQKMQVVRRAALAPAQPSSQDRSVAAEASAQEREARVELAKQRSEELRARQGSEDRSSANNAGKQAPFESAEQPEALQGSGGRGANRGADGAETSGALYGPASAINEESTGASATAVGTRSLESREHAGRRSGPTAR